MATMQRTKRSYTNVETNENFALYMDSDTHKQALISEDSRAEVKRFYICAFTSCDIRLNTKKVIHLPMGTFYQPKEGEQVTHRKFIGFPKFSKV